MQSLSFHTSPRFPPRIARDGIAARLPFAVASHCPRKDFASTTNFESGDSEGVPIDFPYAACAKVVGNSSCDQRAQVAFAVAHKYDLLCAGKKLLQAELRSAPARYCGRIQDDQILIGR